MTVERMEAVLENGMRLSHWEGQLGPSVPFRLEAHSSETWHMPMPPVRHAILASHRALGHANTQEVHVCVHLGTGKTATSKERLLVQGA